MARKFIVGFEGGGFLMQIRENAGLEPVGFFTTRYVEAADEEVAVKEAMQLVRHEITETHLDLRAADGGPVVKVSEVREVDSFGNRAVPGSGFAWFPDSK